MGRFFPARVEPFASVGARIGRKRGVHFPIVAADEFANFLFAFHHHRQGGGLHSAHRGQKKPAIARVKGGHGPRAVDAHQPVGFAAAACGVGQRFHVVVAAQMVKPVAYGLGRHALQPQAADGLAQRLGATGILLNQAKNQFPLSTRVARIYKCVHIFALGQLDHRVQAGFGLVHRLQIKVRRNHGQVGKTPFAAFDVKFFGCLNLYQMAYSAGNQVGVALKKLVVLFKFARHRRECAHDVLRHGGLFGYDQCFHLTTIP